MSVELAKQLIFDVAMELFYGSEGKSDIDLANTLLDALEVIDKEMK